MSEPAGRYVGVDVGGTKVRAALATGAGAIVREAEEPTDPVGGRRLVAQLERLVVEVVRDERDRVVRCGIASPGAIDPATGRTRFSQNIDGLDVVDLPGELETRLGWPVRFGNDVNLAAVAERWLGHGRGCDELAVVSVGTGIGAGLICGGRLVTGHRGAAGEAAELPLVGDPSDPDHRRLGVFESQVGTAGFVRRHRELGGGPADGARDILAAAEDGDPIAGRVTDEIGGSVALGIAAIVALVDPELVVLAGGVGAHPRFAASVERAVRGVLDEPPRLEVSALGDRASLVGAVAVAVLDTV